jgi:hypothetical protein
LPGDLDCVERLAGTVRAIRRDLLAGDTDVTGRDPAAVDTAEETGAVDQDPRAGREP